MNTNLPFFPSITRARTTFGLRVLISVVFTLGFLAGFSPCAGAEYNPPLNGLVAWWRGDGNGNDSAGGHNGAVGSSVSFVPGVFGQAFHFPGGSGDTRVSIADDPAFKLTNSLSISCWIRQQAPSACIFMRGDNRSGLDPYSLGSDVNSGHLHFYLNDASANTCNLESSTAIPSQQWLHVAGTLNGTNGDMRLYVNGILIAETNTTIRPLSDLIPSQNPGLAIGDTLTYVFPFTGDIDEVLLYSRALSPAEVASLAAVDSEPIITLQPAGNVGYWGQTVTFEVEATGTPAPSYLWYKDDVPIDWATNATLVLRNLDFSDAGTYTVQVSNSLDVVWSDPALLIVNPAGITIGLHPFLTITGSAGKSLAIQSTTNVSSTSSWITLTNITLSQPVQEWIDTSVDFTSDPRRFYRLVAIPTP